MVLVITQAPLHSHTLYKQASEYQKNELLHEAIACYKTISIDDPQYLQSLFNLGNCYLSLGEMEESIRHFNMILTKHPTLIPALYNKGYTYKTMGDIDTAITTYKRVIQLDNNYDPAHLALGFAYLIKGDFENGWKQHERYLKKSGKNGDRLRYLLQTNTVAGKTILLQPEGGLGDSLQFIRYAQRLHDQGAYIIACIQKPLIALLSQCTYIDKIITPDSSIPYHDAKATLMSLPAIFHSTDKTLPTIIPYIQADEELYKKWQSFFATDARYKIGICWQADVQNDVSRLPIARRGYPLKYFAPLQNISNISLYSLQKFDGVEEIAQMPSDFPLRCFDNFDEESGPFMDTAAIMKNLDLIITVDTALAHLAGALGCNVWLLLPYATDWRWINNRTDSPWYPTMKIFKQKTPFDWSGVMQEVIKELEKITR